MSRAWLVNADSKDCQCNVLIPRSWQLGDAIPFTYGWKVLSVGLIPMVPWRDYQEQTAQFFRNIGMEAETDVTLHGVRTTHDIDVVVRSHHVGFNLLWLVECKSWRVPVSKLHVLALREIVADIGADRGILMAEMGFQSGAREAARLTNVELTSLAALEVTAGYDLGMAQLRTIVDRVGRCRERYWSLNKETRIDHDLRPDVEMAGYSGRSVLDVIDSALNAAFRDCFPIEASGELAHIVISQLLGAPE